MKIVFNDLSELTVQSVRQDGDRLDIRTISATPADLRAKFSDELACKHIKVVEQNKTLAEYDGFVELDGLTEYNGQIYGVFMYQQDKAPADLLQSLSDQVTDGQEALAELYELILPVAEPAAGETPETEQPADESKPDETPAAGTEGGQDNA